MIDTPRTDAEECEAFIGIHSYFDADDVSRGYGFARQLERELTAAQAEIARLKAGGCARDQRTTQFCGEALKLQERIEVLEDFAKKYRAAYEPPAKHLEHRLFPAEKAALDAYRKAMGDTQ